MILKSQPLIIANNRAKCPEPASATRLSTVPSEYSIDLTRHQEPVAPQKSLSGWRVSCVCAVLLVCFGTSVGLAASSQESSAEKERKLIATLQSDAQPGDKAIACKELAIYGTSAAVPALAPLLANPDLASWARIALEAIPDPAAGDALRAAMASLHGRLLVGTINSIAVRRDSKAVGDLAKRLKDPDADVASAAAIALGRIGGSKPAKALRQALPGASAGVRSAVAQGCILCAEGFLAENKSAEAVKLYDTVRHDNLPKQRILEATRGAILARGTKGIPLLLEQLRSSDVALVGIGLRTARELPGRQVTEALAAELDSCKPDRQAFLVLALADRDDPAALPAITKAARSGSDKVRLAAIGVLDRLGDATTVPVLLEAASAPNTELAQASMNALARLPGNKVDADLLNRLPQSSGKMRRVLVELVSLRRIEGALPEVIRCAKDPDAGVRTAAIQAIGALGQDRQVTDVVGLLSQTQGLNERGDLEAALIAISSRGGAGCAPALLPLAQSSDSELRIIALHALASAGGPDALGAVKSALDDKDDNVQDEAVRTLSTWPNNWPEDATVAEPLLALAQSGKKNSYQVLGLRGYLQYVKVDKKLSDDAKVSKLNELLPRIKRPEEERLAIAVLDAIPSDGSLELLAAFTMDSAVAEDACASMVRIAGKNAPGVTKDQRQKTLQIVIEKAKKDSTRKKAETLLKNNT